MKFIVGKYIYDTEQSEVIGGTTVFYFDMIISTLYRTLKSGKYYLIKEKTTTKERTYEVLSEMDALEWSVKHLNLTVVMGRFSNILELA